MRFTPYPQSKLLEDAAKISRYFEVLRETEQTAELVGLLEGHAVADIVSAISGGNGLSAVEPAPLPTGLPEMAKAEPSSIMNPPNFSSPVVEYDGPPKVSCHKLVNGEVVDDGIHFVVYDGIPRYCLEQSPGKLKGCWVRISPSRMDALLRGSMMMSEKGYVVGNPVWRNWQANQLEQQRMATPEQAEQAMGPASPDDTDYWLRRLEEISNM